MSTKLDVFEKDGKKFPILKLINDETGKSQEISDGVSKAGNHWLKCISLEE